jgi:hypothetical protein
MLYSPKLGLAAVVAFSSPLPCHEDLVHREGEGGKKRVEGGGGGREREGRQRWRKGKEG